MFISHMQINKLENEFQHFLKKKTCRACKKKSCKVKRHVHCSDLLSFFTALLDKTLQNYSGTMRIPFKNNHLIRLYVYLYTNRYCVVR